MGIKCCIKDSTLTFEHSIPNGTSSSKPSLLGLRDYAEEEVKRWEEPRGRDEIKEIVSSNVTPWDRHPDEPTETLTAWTFLSQTESAAETGMDMSPHP